MLEKFNKSLYKKHFDLHELENNDQSILNITALKFDYKGFVLKLLSLNLLQLQLLLQQ